MTGFWLISYVALWVLVVSLVLLQVGTLREFGMMRSEGEETKTSANLITLPEAVGPVIGAELPRTSLESINSRGVVTLGAPGAGRSLLLTFMSPSCSGCQHAVNPLNKLAEGRSGTVEVIAVMVSDVRSCNTFLDVFPLNLPVVCDENEALAHAFDVHNIPFSLLYDGRGLLVRKGWTEDKNDLAALFGDDSAPREALDHVYPRPSEPIKYSDIQPLVS